MAVAVPSAASDSVQTFCPLQGIAPGQRRQANPIGAGGGTTPLPSPLPTPLPAPLPSVAPLPSAAPLPSVAPLPSDA